MILEQKLHNSELTWSKVVIKFEQQNAELKKDNEQITSELKAIKQQNIEMKKDNDQLKQQITELKDENKQDFERLNATLNMAIQQQNTVIMKILEQLQLNGLVPNGVHT